MSIYNKARKISKQIVGIFLKRKGEDIAEFHEWLSSNRFSVEVMEMLSSSEALSEGIKNFSRKDKNIMFIKLKGKIQKRRIQKHIIKFSVAAVIFITGCLFLFLKKSDREAEFNNRTGPVLILANGENVDLYSLKNHRFKSEGINIEISGSEEIKYSVIETNRNDRRRENVNNILIVPSQCTYRIVLNDGTVVHLNAGSRLEYPVSFVNEKRIVKLKGEAYFEVLKDSVPFSVIVNDVRIKVYGTKFGVKAYREDKVETVLVEGSVGVFWGNNQKLLKPSQLLKINTFTGVYSLVYTDTECYMAWIKGYLKYNDRRLEEVLEDISFWYGEDFEYAKEDIKELRLTASINKKLSLASILSMMEKTLNLSFVKKERGYLILNLN